MTERVTAEAILRARDGTSVAGATEPPTSDNIDSYVIEDGVFDEATSLLQGRGIEVLQRGPVSLTISAEKAVFEDVFHASLEAGGAGAGYTASTPLEVPSEMKSVIAEVTLPMQPTFYP